MSGGSYNYLYYMPIREMIESGNVRRMGERLKELGYAEDAARETLVLADSIEKLCAQVESTQERLWRVWKAVEWLDSWDWSEDQVREVIDEWKLKHGTSPDR